MCFPHPQDPDTVMVSSTKNLVRVALAAGPKSRTQRQDRSWSDGEQVYLVQPGVKQEVGWSGAYQAGGSEDCRLEVTIQKL